MPLKTSLFHQNFSYHDLYLTHNYSTLFTDKMGQFSFSSLAQSCPTLCDPMNPMTQSWLSLFRRFGLRLFEVLVNVKGAEVCLGSESCDRILLLPALSKCNIEWSYQKKMLATILDVKPQTTWSLIVIFVNLNVGYKEYNCICDKNNWQHILK